VADVIAADNPEAHVKAVQGWAEDVWAAWVDHHKAIRSFIERKLAQL
jgi:hypothetical protein